MSCKMLKNASTRASAPRGRLIIVCQATLSRRALLGAALLPAVFAYVPKAMALIPDEEDAAMVEKAKANRRARLAQQRGVTRDFMVSENLKDVRLEQELAPLQQAVYELAKSGGQLEGGDLQGAASTLAGPWVADFSSVATAVSGAEAAGKLAAGILQVQAAAANGDAAGSKRLFVTLVSDVQSWASYTGLAGSLKGL